jgi:two-component system OmpR family sensor kinase
MSRLPLRGRLVAGFAIAMVIVLAGSGGFVYWRVAYALDRRLNSDLADNASIVTALIGPEGNVGLETGLGTTPALTAFQVLRPDNTVASSGPGLGSTSLLTPEQLRTAQDRPITVDLGSMVPISAQPLRLRAAPVGPYVLVVGVRRDARDEALRELIVQLVLAGLGTLLITTVVGERLAKAALRPVERYRAQAAEIASGRAGVRLDVPKNRDDEVTRLGQTLNTMLDALEDASARERRFLADASHELRTPLTLLRTRTQLALSRPRTVAEHEDTLRELDTDVRELSVLADQLLQLGAATDGKAGSSLADPGDAADVLAALHRQTTNEPVTGLPDHWALDLPATSAHVSMPAPELRQVVTNLLGNSAVHGQPPVQATLRVHEGPDRGVVIVSVSDAGGDLSPDFLPRAVERFGRDDQARARPGSGLGLSLVLALVDAYGGELRLCSEGRHHRYRRHFEVPCTHPGTGTTVSVLLQEVSPRT